MRPFDKPALSVEQQLEWLKHEACTSICPLMVKLAEVEIAGTRHRFVTHSSRRKTLAVQPLNEGQKTADCVEKVGFSFYGRKVRV